MHLTAFLSNRIGIILIGNRKKHILQLTVFINAAFREKNKFDKVIKTDNIYHLKK